MKKPLLRHGLLALGLAAASLGASAQTLLHHFSFSDGAESIVNGLGTASGTLVGSAAIVDGALHLPGTTAYIDLGPLIPVAADYNQSFWTVSVWARQATGDASGFDTLVSQGAIRNYSPDYTLALRSNAGANAEVLAQNRSGWGGGVVSAVSDVGHWNLYTTVSTHTSVTLYVNGVYVGANARGQNPCCFQSQAARIGRDVDGGDPTSQFIGDIDDVRIYSGLLSQQAIAAQYTAGRTVLAAVPEPSSWMLFAAGLMILAGLVRRRLSR